MTEKNIRNASITDEQIKLYGTVFPLMKSIYSEIKDFSKTGKTKSTKLKNEKYRINKSKQQNEKYKEGAIF